MVAICLCHWSLASKQDSLPEGKGWKLKWRTSHQTHRAHLNPVSRLPERYLLLGYLLPIINQLYKAVSWALCLALLYCLVRSKTFLCYLKCNDSFRCLIWIVRKTKFSNYIVDPAQWIQQNMSSSNQKKKKKTISCKVWTCFPNEYLVHQALEKRHSNKQHTIVLFYQCQALPATLPLAFSAAALLQQCCAAQIRNLLPQIF